MAFHSILYPGTIHTPGLVSLEAPDFFDDLHLDLIVGSVTKDWKQYDLAPFFFSPLHTPEEIVYRQEIFQDFENPVLLKAVRYFSEQMSAVRERIREAPKLNYKYAIERWFLNAAGSYCQAVESLVHDLADVSLQSQGMRAFRDYVVQ